MAILILQIPEVIQAACELGHIVVFLGDEHPFGQDSDDNLVACKVMNTHTQGGPTFWVIGSQDNRDLVTQYACEIVQGIGGKIQSIQSIVPDQDKN